MNQAEKIIRYRALWRAYDEIKESRMTFERITAEAVTEALGPRECPQCQEPLDEGVCDDCCINMNEERKELGSD